MGFKDISDHRMKWSKRFACVSIPCIAVIAGIAIVALKFFGLEPFSLNYWIFLIVLGGVFFLVSGLLIPNAHKLNCPYCRSDFLAHQPWVCPSCGNHHLSHTIFGECAKCGIRPAAFECPVCKQVMITSKPALSWDRELVLKHVARAVVPPDPAPPPPDPPPQPNDKVRAIVEDALRKSLESTKRVPRSEVLTAYVANAAIWIRDELNRWNTEDLRTALTNRLIDTFKILPDAAFEDSPTSIFRVPLRYFFTNLAELEATYFSPYFDPLPYVALPLETEPVDFDVIEHKRHNDNERLRRLNEDPRTDCFQGFLACQIPLPVNPLLRFEHQWVVAKTGHGKTSLFQQFIKHDLDTDCSIIVIDTQGAQSDLVKYLTHAKELKDYLVYLDPTDIEYPLALSLFRMGQERMGNLSPLDQERLRGTVSQLLTFVLQALIGADMTPKQQTLFSFLLSAMMVIPDSNIMTLRRFLEEDGHLPYLKYLDLLSETDKLFLRTQYIHERAFTDTKQQLSWRLDSLLQNRVFTRMFSATHSKLDLFKEMQGNRVIVINADKDLLKKEGTEIYARFFIALIAAAVQERISTVPESERKPCYVYMDEFGDYAGTADTHIADLLKQARKAKVGITIGHTELQDLSDKTASALQSNTASKFAADLRHVDASKLARDMRCDAEFIQNQPKFTFASYIKGQTRALPLTFKPGALQSFERMTSEEFREFRQRMRERYSFQPAQEQWEEPDDIQDAEFEEVHEEPEPTNFLRLTGPRKRKRPKRRGRPPGDVDTAAS